MVKPVILYKNIYLFQHKDITYYNIVNIIDKNAIDITYYNVVNIINKNAIDIIYYNIVNISHKNAIILFTESSPVLKIKRKITGL